MTARDLGARAKVFWQARRRAVPTGAALAYAASCVAGKLPQAVGIARYALQRLRRRPIRLIEYK